MTFGQKYWFVLTSNNLLTYYSDENQTNLEGQLLLDGLRDLNQNDTKYEILHFTHCSTTIFIWGVFSRFEFKLPPTKQQFVFESSETEQWMKVLENIDEK